MPKAARVNDQHQCPSGVIGTLLPNLAPMKVMIQGLPAAVVTTPATPCAPGPNMVQSGSSKVKICGMKAARVTDMTAHGSTIIKGSSKVTIGG